MTTADLSQALRTIETLATGAAVAPGSAPPSKAARYGVSAARLLVRDNPRQHRDLEEGLGWLAATGDQPDAWPATDGIPGNIFRAVVLHIHCTTFLARYESLPHRLWGACEHHVQEAVQPARHIERYSDVPPAPGDVDQVLWDALCIHDQARALGRDADVEMVDSVVHHAVTALAALDTPTAASKSQPADPHTPQLRSLHALADLALHRRNRSWARTMDRLAQNTRNTWVGPPPCRGPWALFAFAWSGCWEGSAQGPGTAASGSSQALEAPSAAHGEAIALMLLADAAYCLRCFGTPAAG